MRVRWRGFELPTKVTCDQATLSTTYGRFVAEPFERGFGITVGNSLRRVLLSSLEGVAVTAVKFEGVQHEFSTIPGVYEDVTDIVLNLKQILLRITTDEPKWLRIEARKKGPITAADIQTDATTEVVNPDLPIATLTEDAEFRAEIQVRRGRGYRTADENAEPEQQIGIIPVASFFSPVRRVKYSTEYTRVGQRTNYDKLVLEVWTNGTITPDMAVVEAAKILRKHFDPFVHYFAAGRELAPQALADEPVPVIAEGAQENLAERLQIPISDLDLSVRASNCIEAENITSLGDLVSRTEDDLLKLRNFGKTTLKEIQKKLAEHGLSLGMNVTGAKK